VSSRGQRTTQKGKENPLWDRDDGRKRSFDALYIVCTVFTTSPQTRQIHTTMYLQQMTSISSLFDGAWQKGNSMQITLARPPPLGFPS
jgi:hypothetical protein